MMKTIAPSRKSQSGVMLLEALIGILIFSLGVLALVGMQALAVKVATESRERAEASNLASQLIGEMWTNRGVAGANLANYNYVAGSGAVPAALVSWVSQVQSALPNADVHLPSVVVGAPALAGVAGNEVVVTVQWMAPGATTARRFQMSAYIN